MVKSTSIFGSVLVLLSITFVASSDTNILYQIGELNNKLTYLQQKLDLFDYITDGDVSELQHRVEVNESKCAETVSVQIQATNEKLNDLESKLDSLATLVSKKLDTGIGQNLDITVEV